MFFVLKVNVFRLQVFCVNVLIKVSGNLSINFYTLTQFSHRYQDSEFQCGLSLLKTESCGYQNFNFRPLPNANGSKISCPTKCCMPNVGRNAEVVFENWDSKVNYIKNQLNRSGKGHFLINTYLNPNDLFSVSELSVISIQSNCSKFMTV